ncbi:ABC transporter ATP-binding protein [Nocardioides mesophilus]|uniref:ABC transporter ATP-binding protein n=1 Tax=Nocardioides mesophilus TaxID=433659 RepID=A0A7G9R8S3_9ACTN|nr:ABC transporter ATP-binding protein [Nocardioides mesophilus]QNN51998.1 ABC transporter ATP-binding protein [Nocardioides mesophilus]
MGTTPLDGAAALVGLDLRVVGPGRLLLDEVSVTASPGRMLAVTGSSGSGKTTLLSVLGGLLRPDSGQVSYAGGPVGTRHGEPRAGTALVLQTYGLVPSLTAEENVSVALRARGVGPRDAVSRSTATLDRLGVGDLVDRLISELSGGQLQRVAVSRALAVEPEVLLADEPTSELDETNRDRVVAELRAEADRGAVVVVATHDPDVAAACDDELHLVDGRVEGLPAGVPVEVIPGHEHDPFRRPGS